VVPRVAWPLEVFDYDHRHAYALLHVSAAAQGSTSWPEAVLCAPSQTVFDLPVSTDCFGRLPYSTPPSLASARSAPAMSAAPFCRPPRADCAVSELPAQTASFMGGLPRDCAVYPRPRIRNLDLACLSASWMTTIPPAMSRFWPYGARSDTVVLPDAYHPFGNISAMHQFCC